MKKLLSVSAMALVLLAGCGSSATSYKGESAPATDADHKDEVTTVSYDKDGDDITNVKFDITLPDSEVSDNNYSSSSKYDVSQAGEYGMGDQTGTSWYQHVDKLDKYVEDNDAFPTLNDDGKDADGVSGATIGLSTFEEAFNNAKEA